MNMSEMLFQNWEGIFRTVAVGILAYTVLILFLRISGKHTLAKLNAFDLVVTVALGSTLSAILLQESVAFAEGAVARPRMDQRAHANRWVIIGAIFVVLLFGLFTLGYFYWLM